MNIISFSLRGERVTAAATALLLQAAVYWALSQLHRPLTVVSEAPSLIAMILTAARPRPQAPPPMQMSERLVPVPVTENSIPRPITPVEPQRSAPQSPIDWQGAIQHEVRAEDANSKAPPRLRFDLRAMPATKAPPPEFGWDEASTHRIQRLTQGVFDLGEHCSIRLWPPIPECHFGPGNGDLFKHMHDRPQAGKPGSLP